MNPDVIIKLEEYQSFIEKSKELEELKRNIDISELNKYLESNPTVNFGLTIREGFSDKVLSYTIENYNNIKPLPSSLIYQFIRIFNSKLYSKYAEIEQREILIGYKLEKKMNKLTSLVDTTSFKKVMNYVQNPNSEILGFVNVENEELDEIGLMFVDGDTKSIKDLLLNKKLSFRHLSDNQAVDVLYLPPYYLIKPLNKEYK